MGFSGTPDGVGVDSISAFVHALQAHGFASITHLCDATIAQLDAAAKCMNQVVLARVRHVITESERTTRRSAS
jgi:galactokinase